MSNEANLTVLVPLDGSPRAERALAYLPVLAHIGPLNVRLIAVVDEKQSIFSTLPDDVQEGERNALAVYLDAKAKDLVGIVASAETSVALGSPASLILDEAERIAADLMIISTHGRSGLERWHLGSVADKVIRGAPCNTLVIGPEADAPTPAIRSILVPLDGSKHAEEALDVARRLAEPLGAELHVLTVVPPAILTARYSYLREQLLGESVAQANTYLAGLKTRLGDAKTSVAAGPPVQTILEFIRENSIDLVVMTSHGQGGISRAVLGSVTDRLLGGGAPVLVVKGTDTTS